MAMTQPNLHLFHVPPLPSGFRKRTTAQQSQSPLFRLPLELRRLILREAFGGHTIHIHLRPPVVALNLRRLGGKKKTRPNYWRRLIPWLTAKPAPDEGEWVWASHCFWHDGLAKAKYGNGWGCDLPAIVDDGGGPCCWNGDDFWPHSLASMIRVLGFLLSCQRAYGETLFALYTTNTIAFKDEHLIDGLLRQSTIPGAPRLTGQGMRLVTALQLRSSLILWRSPFYPDDGLIAKHRALLAEQLELLPRAFPNLWSLTWLPSLRVYDHEDYFPPGQLDEVEELLLEPLLRFSTMIPTLRKFLVPIPNHLFFTVMLLEQKRPEGRQDFLGQPLGEIRMWYPFTVSPGTRGPDGGGFWLVFGGERNREWAYDGTVYGGKIV